jgi:hypothetical protein
MLLEKHGQEVKKIIYRMSVLQNYVVSLPNGSEGTLYDFYLAVMDNSIEVNDKGYILSDGTLVPTSQEPLFGANEEEMLALMSQYIIDENGMAQEEEYRDEENISETREMVEDEPRQEQEVETGIVVSQAAITIFIFGAMIYFLAKNN